MRAPAGFARAVVRMLTPDGGGRAVRVALSVAGGGARLRFAPGQWVDLVAPGAPEGSVGGYTIASTPAELARTGTLEVLVRRSAHPMASWINDSMAVGDDVALRVGGAMVLTEAHARKGILAVAGGIGISPIAAMLANAAECATTTAAGGDQALPRAPAPALTLLYSCRRAADFALVDRLENAAEAAEAAGGRLRLVAHVTGDRGGDGGEPSLSRRWEVRSGRVTPQALQEAFDELAARLQRRGNTTEGEGPTTVACGPPAATDAWARALAELRPTPTAVLTERWW